MIHKVLLFEYLEVEDDYYGGSEFFQYNEILDKNGVYLECNDADLAFWREFVQWNNRRGVSRWGGYSEPSSVKLGLIEIHNDPQESLEERIKEFEKSKKKEEEKKKKNRERAKKAQETKRLNKIKKLSNELGISETEVEEMLRNKEQ